MSRTSVSPRNVQQSQKGAFQPKSPVREALVPCDLASLPYSITNWPGTVPRNVAPAQTGVHSIWGLRSVCLRICQLDVPGPHTCLILRSFTWPPTSAAWPQATPLLHAPYTTYPQSAHPECYRNSGSVMCQDPYSRRNDICHLSIRSQSQAAHGPRLYPYLNAHVCTYASFCVSVHAYEWLYLHMWINISTSVYVCVNLYSDTVSTMLSILHTASLISTTIFEVDK